LNKKYLEINMLLVFLLVAQKMLSKIVRIQL